MISTVALAILVSGLAAGGLGSFIKALPWWTPEQKKAKPLGCPVCMAGWSSLLTVSVCHYYYVPVAPLIEALMAAAFIWLGSMGVGAWIIAAVSPSWEL